MPPKRSKSPKKSLAEIVAEEKAKFQLKSNKAAEAILKAAPIAIPRSRTPSPSPSPKLSPVSRSSSPKKKNYLSKSPIVSPSLSKKIVQTIQIPVKTTNRKSTPSPARVNRNIRTSSNTPIVTLKSSNELNETIPKSIKKSRSISSTPKPALLPTPLSIPSPMPTPSRKRGFIPPFSSEKPIYLTPNGNDNGDDEIEVEDDEYEYDVDEEALNELEQDMEYDAELDSSSVNTTKNQPSSNNSNNSPGFAIPKNYYSAMFMDGIVVLIICCCIFSYMFMPTDTNINMNIHTIITTTSDGVNTIKSHLWVIISCILVCSIIIYIIQLRMYQASRKNDINIILVRLLKHHIRHKVSYI